ncbi:MAG: DUF6364 family protein [Lentisphaeraceae bacterium]|nr:DUF6364 family protein [Lentisphaeraceae bacterium]
MSTKLTLSINEQVIAKAKRYAQVHKTSVSQIVEQYLGEITAKEEIELSGVVAELAGIIPEVAEDRIEYLEKKYS